jgi:hypothetical protein
MLPCWPIRTRVASLRGVTALPGLVPLHLCLLTGASGPAHPPASAGSPSVESPANLWTGTLEAGTTAVAANNVLPLPLAIGVGLLLERRRLGVAGAVHIDAATICDKDNGGDGSCGLLWIWDVTPRFTLAPLSPFSPYASIRVQLTDSSRHGLVPAAGPRLGLRYRGKAMGVYLEGGPSFVRAEDGAFGRFISNRRWFPQLSAGATFHLW